MREKIERLENILMELARGFGAVLMSITLAVLTVVLLVFLAYKGYQGIKKVGSVFERSSPRVVFYKSDFAQMSEEVRQSISSSDRRPEEPERILARSAVMELMPLYQKSVDDFLRSRAEQYGLVSSEDRSKFRDAKIEEFKNENGNVTVVTNILSALEEKFQSDYADKMVKYMEEAQKSGVDPFPDGNANLYYNAVRGKFHELYMQDLREINARNSGDKSSDMADLIGSASIYAAVFFLVIIFLMQTIAFSMSRIEKKMK